MNSAKLALVEVADGIPSGRRTIGVIRSAFERSHPGLVDELFATQRARFLTEWIRRTLKDLPPPKPSEQQIEFAFAAIPLGVFQCLEDSGTWKRLDELTLDDCDELIRHTRLDQIGNDKRMKGLLMLRAIVERNWRDRGISA